ncbi:MAG: hypothetical protein FJY91_00225 [Candidatus Harrisonbacteria bacterium]|nr:hypothetical protein [Candidatus Harrisonbacteria bacterium]
MDKIKGFYQNLFQQAGFSDFSIDFDLEENRLLIFLYEGEWLKRWLSEIVGSLLLLERLKATKENREPIRIDVNNYRKERERIISDLAKAAAKKAVFSKGEVKLPVMNAYERRIVHEELSIRPDVKTESEGEGKNRRVVIKPI